MAMDPQRLMRLATVASMSTALILIVAKLDRLTVRFFKPDANVVTSGDTAGNTAVSLCLEIKTDPALRRQMF